MDNFIDGKFQTPAQGLSNELDVAVAVRAAHKALKGWSESDKRIEALRAVGKILEGKEDLRSGAKYFLAAENNEDSAIGVCGIISSYEFAFLCQKIAGALSRGNTIVVKPSSKNPDSRLAEAFIEAGVPNGVCNIIFGKGEPVGSYLVQHPGVPMISFTGTQFTARKVLALAAPFTKRVHLDLGGKNAAIVMADADIDGIIPRLTEACFANGGQSAHSVSKIIIHESRAKEFTEKFVARARSMKPTPLYNLKRAQEFVALARKENGRVLCGGEGDFSPCVIEDLTNCSEIHQTELLAPIVTLTTFKYPFDAVKLANTSPYGLSASVWGKAVSAKTTAALEVGTVWINQWGVFDPGAPYGGIKGSGSGVRSIREIFSNRKTVLTFDSFG